MATKHLREPKKEKVNTGYIVLPTLAKKPTAEVVDDDSFEEPEAAAVVSMDSRPNTGLIPLNSTSSRPASRAIASKSSANISSDMPLHEEHKPAVEEEPGANVEDLLKGFDKTCALCVQTFPKKSLEMKVLWKHVIALRRSWNPALVPKVITALDQSITMYNLVNVCAFCAQFFDPDFPGGIAYPQQEPAKAHPSGVVGAIIEEKKPFLKYLDTRHLDNTKSAMTRANTTNALLTQLHTSGLPHTAGNAQRLSISSANSSLCLSGISAAPESTGSGERWWEGVLGDSDCSDIEGLSFKDGESSLGGNSSGDDSRNYLRSASVLMSRARARRAVAIEKEMELQSGVLMEQR